MIYIPTRTIRSRFPNRELVSLILEGHLPSSSFITGETALDIHYKFQRVSDRRIFNLRASWMVQQQRTTYTSNSVGEDGADFSPGGSLPMTAWNSKLKGFLANPEMKKLFSDIPEGIAYQEFISAPYPKLEQVFGRDLFPT